MIQACFVLIKNRTLHRRIVDRFFVSLLSKSLPNRLKLQRIKITVAHLSRVLFLAWSKLIKSQCLTQSKHIFNKNVFKFIEWNIVFYILMPLREVYREAYSKKTKTYDGWGVEYFGYISFSFSWIGNLLFFIFHFSFSSQSLLSVLWMYMSEKYIVRKFQVLILLFMIPHQLKCSVLVLKRKHKE